MKRINLIVFCAVICSVIAGCSDGYTELDEATSQERLNKVFSTSNVVNAKGFVNLVAGSRADDEAGWYKIDQAGDYSKLYVTGTDGRKQDIEICNVGVIDNRWVFLSPTFYSVLEAVGVYKKGSTHNYDIEATLKPRYILTILADINSGKLYKLPPVALYMESMQIHNGVYYFIGRMPEPDQVFGDLGCYGGFSTLSVFDIFTNVVKFDPSNLTIEEVLPPSQELESFMVMNDGSVVYSEDWSRGFKLVTTAGTLLRYTQSAFCLNGEIYSITDGTLNKIVVDSSLNLQKIEIGPASHEGISGMPFMTDSQRGTGVFYGYNRPSWDTSEVGYFEFNGQTLTYIPQLEEHYYDREALDCKDYWVLIPDRRTLNKDLMLTWIAKADYAVSVPNYNYQWTEVVAQPDSNGVACIGISFTNQDNVTANVFADGRVEITSQSPASRKIATFIPIN